MDPQPAEQRILEIHEESEVEGLVLGNGWDIQGGATFNFNTETGKLEITAKKEKLNFFSQMTTKWQ